MNSNVETTDLLRLLVKRALECQGAAASSDQLPDNTAQHDLLSSRSAATSTSENIPSTGTMDRSAARQETWITFLKKYVLASAELESFISDQELQIERLKCSLVEQKAKMTILERQLEDREKEVADRERNILKRESGIVERERSVAEREQVALDAQEKIESDRETLQKDKENARKELLDILPSKFTEGSDGESKDLGFYLWGSQKCVRKLLECGGNPLAKNEEGWTPLL